MGNRLFGVYITVALSFFGVSNVGADANAAESNCAEMKIVGEVKDVIIAEFEGQKQSLRLFDDNGDKTAEKERTFSFVIIRLTSSGAKLKLSAGEGISRENGEWIISKQNNDDKCVLEFSLLGTSRDGRLEQRFWDNGGDSYTFTENDDVGEWRIVIEPVTKIKREKPGMYKGSIKVSIVAE